jgi:hypothetical protein
MRVKAVHPLVEATAAIAQFSISDSVDPFLVTLPRSLTPNALNSTLAAMYEFTPETAFSLNRIPDEDESPSPPFCLTEAGAFPPSFSGNFRITYSNPTVSIDERYDFLRDSNFAIEPVDQIEQFYAIASGQSAFDAYLSPLFMHRFLYRACLDIVRGRRSPLAKSLVCFLGDAAAVTVCRRDIATHVLVDVLATLFGGTSLWGSPQPPSTVDCWPQLISFLAGLIANRSICYANIRKALCPFCPSLISKAIPIEVALCLRRRMTDADIFRTVSDIFPDSFLFRCFLNHTELFKRLVEADLGAVFPYVLIRCYLLQTLENKIDPESASAIMSQLGLGSLASSSRIVPAVIDPIFGYIYDRVLDDRLPYLEMSAVELKEVVNVLTSMITIMKDSVGSSRPVQVYVLTRLQKLLAKRGFEPKGLCFTRYGFLYDRGIVHDAAFNSYLQMNSKTPSPGKNSVILEINTFLLTLIPGPFPDMGRDTMQKGKKAATTTGRAPAPSKP